MNTKQPLFKASDVADRLNVSLRHAYHLMNTGQIRSTPVGGKAVRVHPDDLDAYINRQRGAEQCR